MFIFNIKSIFLCLLNLVIFHFAIYSQNFSIYDVDITPDTAGDFGICIGTDLIKSGIRYNYYNSDEYPDSNYHYLSMKAIDDKDSTGLFLTDGGIVVIGTASPCLKSEEYKLYVTGSIAVEGSAYKDDGSSFWSALSDQRLKKNIKPLAKSLDRLLAIGVYEYAYKKNNIERYGIMAQEIQEILPKTVTTTFYDGEEVLKFNPNDLFYLHIKATQELAGKLAETEGTMSALTAENKQLKKELNQLQDQLNNITELLTAKGIQTANANTNTTNTTKRKPMSETAMFLDTPVKLYDAQPNPFTQAVTIPYRIPADALNAQIIIRDASSRLLETFTLTHSGGKGEILFEANKHNLSSGAYFYTLSIDGEQVDTKQIMLVRD